MSRFEETLKLYIDPRWTFGMTVSIGPGWETLVLNAHARLVAADPTYQIIQIKEKFGGLRYYTAQSTKDPALWNTFREIISTVETFSYKVCEQCGTQNNVSTGPIGEGYFWIFTLCDDCRTARFEEREAKRE